jgi:hypothetical protein
MGIAQEKFTDRQEDGDILTKLLLHPPAGRWLAMILNATLHNLGKVNGQTVIGEAGREKTAEEIEKVPMKAERTRNSKRRMLENSRPKAQREEGHRGMPSEDGRG